MKIAKTEPKARSLKTIYNNVHAERSEADDVYCSVSLASHSKFCWCGATVLGSLCMEQWAQFMDFVESPRNSMLHFCDPADQQGIMEVLKVLGANSASELFRILFVVAMISNEAVILEIGLLVKSRLFTALDKMLKERARLKKPTFRGGNLQELWLRRT